jgi:hypothetical protein
MMIITISYSKFKMEITIYEMNIGMGPHRIRASIPQATVMVIPLKILKHKVWFMEHW